jgi:tape measure domain-containing protein
MAKLGDLVVRIGADTRDLNKSLGRVQRNMRSMTGNFERLGQTMTRSLTLPLAAFGAAAIKSAADLETLETSFVSLTGGAEQAAAMMKQLNEFTAATPFQIENVANAARQLIASGTEISQVNEQLQFLGDIASTSGSSIEEIAAIFAKVNAKGKVELENLNQLAERGIPIFKALADATGLPADALGAGAVSVEQFNQVLKGFAEEGGFAAGAMERLSKTAAGRFSTALDNVKLALGNMGKQVLPLVNQGLEKITVLFQGLAKLSPTTLKMAGAMAAVAGSIGPLLTLVPKIIAGITALKGAFLLTTPAILGVAAVVGTVIGLFLRIKNEASASAEEVREVQRALDELTETELRRELGVTKLAGREAINERIAESLDRVAEANRELEAIEARIQAGGEGLRAVYANRINDIKEYAATFERSADAGELLLQFLDNQEQSLTRVGETTHEVTGLLAKLEAQQIKTHRSMGQFFSWLENVAVESTVKATMTMGEFFSMLENVEVQTVKVADAANNMGNAIADAFGRAAQEAMSFGQAVAMVAREVIIAYLAQTKAKILQNSVEGAAGTGPAYPIVMAALLSAGMGIMNRVQIPALAEGGLAYGPTTALIGDNRNARIDPEVVAPLSKLRDMMGGNQVEVFGRISGNDIYLSNSRTGTSRNRYA